MYSLWDNAPISPWRPKTSDVEQWPPDYKGVYQWRLDTLRRLKSDAGLLRDAKSYYRLRSSEFVMDWCDTYDPRRAGSKWIPFVFFPKQHELFMFLDACLADKENGLIEKSRDLGATWGCSDWSVWAWLFIDAVAVGWGSRKKELVDRIGDMSSIFEKLRATVNRIPSVFRPERFDMSFMKLINHDTGGTIAGEIGDSIGRGGRTTIYFKDESAHYEHPEAVEAALGDNTNVQIDLSSVNGPGNVFHRKREAGIEWPQQEPGKTRVFIMDWSHHPEKTRKWYETRKARYKSEGLEHVFAQEVDRNYFSAVANTVIDGEWIDHAIDLHLEFPELAEGKNIAGFDVADGGIDKNALVGGKGLLTDYIDEWGDRDPGVATRRVINYAVLRGICDVMYDSIGVGSAAKSEFNRQVELKRVDPSRVRMYPWAANDEVQDKFEHIIPGDEDSMMNVDFFQNVRTQAWWNVRNRFRRAFEYKTQGVKHPPHTMLSIGSKIPKHLLLKLKKELVQPVHKPSASLKLMIDKKPDGVASPNIADSFVMRYFPLYNDGGYMFIGTQKS